MRNGWVIAAILASLGALAIPAWAADHGVEVVTGETRFAPATIVIARGDSVSFHHKAGQPPHNVHFEDGAFDKPADPSAEAYDVTRTFAADGVFRYYCEQHGGPGGQGMSGKVIVTVDGRPPTDTVAPVVTGARTSPSPCVLLHPRTCTRPGVRLRFRSSEKGKFSGVLARRPLARGSRLRGTGSFSGYGLVGGPVASGANSLIVDRAQSGRRLIAGQYRMSIRVTDAFLNRSRLVTVLFFIKRQG